MNDCKTPARHSPYSARQNESPEAASRHAVQVPADQGLTLVHSQLNLSCVCHKKTPYKPFTPPNTPLPQATQPYAHPLSDAKRSS